MLYIGVHRTFLGRIWSAWTRALKRNVIETPTCVPVRVPAVPRHCFLWWPVLPPHDRWLDVSSNGLSGSLPSSISGLSQLVYLSVANNALTGQLPGTLQALSQLVYVPPNR